MKNHSRKHSMVDVRRLTARYRWRFVFLFFGIATLMVLACSRLPHRYEARALFERRNDLVFSQIASRGGAQPYANMSPALVQEISGVLAVERAVDQLQLAGPEPTGNEARREYDLRRQALINSLAHKLVVSFEVSTPELDRVRVSLVDTDPQRARALVNRVIQNYIDSARNQVDRKLRETATFFEGQAESVRTQVAEHEETRLAFQLANAGMLPSDTRERQRDLTDLEHRIAQARHRQTTARHRIRWLESNLRRHNPEVKRLRVELDALTAELKKATTVNRMTEHHPLVVTLEQNIADIKQRLAQSQVESAVAPVDWVDAGPNQLDLNLLETRSELESAIRDEEAAQARLAELQQQDEHMLEVRSEHLRLERVGQQLRDQLAFWEDNARRVKMSLVAESGNRGMSLHFIKPCPPLMAPNSPRFIHALLLALATAAGVAAAYVALAERLNQTVDTIDAAQRCLGVPVLAAVGNLRDNTVRRFGSRVAFPLVVLILAGIFIGAAWFTRQSIADRAAILASMTDAEPGHRLTNAAVHGVDDVP